MFEKVKANLERNGFGVSVFETSVEAAAYLDEAIDGRTVGFGGSGSLDQLGLYDMLKGHNQVFWHWRKEDADPSVNILAEAQRADIYLSSVNGLAETGEIINIDGIGNRVSATLYGHQKVYFVVGKNKIAETFELALHRARNIAGPRNAKRLGKRTPCVQTGYCMDCRSPERICRELSVLWRCPMQAEYEVVLVKEDLGM